MLFGLIPSQVSQLLKTARTQTRKALPTKGYYFDQGMKPSHKAEIIALYEQGYDEADIARLSQHAQSSVGHYLRNYERVKELCKSRLPMARFPRLLDMLLMIV